MVTHSNPNRAAHDPTRNGWIDLIRKNVNQAKKKSQPNKKKP